MGVRAAVRSFAALAATAVALTCGGQSSRCISGQSIACAGSGGCTGFQVCRVDGTYDACQCGSVAIGADAGSGPVTIASLISPPTRVLSDGTMLYWIDAASHELTSMPVQGGPTKVVFSSRDLTPDWLFVDSDNVYFMAAGGVNRLPKSGGSPVPLGDGQAHPRLAAARHGTAVWIEPEMASGGGFYPPFAVRSAPLAGGPPSVLGQLGATEPFAIAATAAAVVLVNPGNASSFEINLEYLPIAGGAPTSVPGLGACGILESDDDAAYCASAGTGMAPTPITRIASDGTVTVIAAPDRVSAVAVDATDVYWMDGAQFGRLLRASKKGGTPVLLARESAPGPIAVDDAAVYWFNAAGEIKRLPK